MKYKSMRGVAARAVACGLAALVVGCGGGGSEAPPGPPAASVYAGSLQTPGSRDGTGAVAQFSRPSGVAQMPLAPFTSRMPAPASSARSRARAL